MKKFVTSVLNNFAATNNAKNKIQHTQNHTTKSKKTKHKKSTPLRPIRSGGGQRVAPFTTNWAHCVQWRWCAA